MVKISTTIFLGYPFSIVYDTHLIFSGFFQSADLPKEVMHLNPLQESESLAKEICAWYEEADRKLPLPLNLKGTPFQRNVWDAISQIEKGKLITYTQLALNVQNSAAVRAVGTACSRNPLTLVIPCHRIKGITSLGGYRWGLDIKKCLLQYESVSLQSVAQV